MRMGAFLRDARCLHQPAIDVAVNLSEGINDLLGKVLTDYGQSWKIKIPAARSKTESRSR